MSKTDTNLDDMTISQLMKAMKPAHLVVIVGLFFSLIGGAFGFGITWEKHRFDVEVTPLKKLNTELQEKIANLKNQIEFYREKDKLISLTSALQFQASLRDIKHHEIFTCSGTNEKLSNEHVSELYKEYQDTLKRITNAQDGKEPIAFLGPVSRACRPRLISFEKDQSAAYKINNFIPNN